MSEEEAGPWESGDDKSGVGAVGADTEKKPLRAAEQEAPASQEERAVSQQTIQSLTAGQRLFVDETGS